MLIDCATCPVRGQGCAGCMVTELFGGVPADLDAPPVQAGRAEVGMPGRGRPMDEVDRAIAVLAAAGVLAPISGDVISGAPWVRVA